MAWNFSFSFGRSQEAISAERYNDGTWFYWLDDIFGKRSTAFGSYDKKLKTVIDNPAVLKPLTFIADTYSQVRFDAYNNDKIVTTDALYTVLPKPNYWQSWTDVLWDLAFFRAVGFAPLYSDGKMCMVLNPSGIKLTDDQVKLFQTLSISKYGIESRIKNQTFKYKMANGNTLTLEMKYLTVINDLSGTITGNYFDGGSRLDALYQVAKNASLASTSKGRNLWFTRKFFASGDKSAVDNINKKPMGDVEKQSVEQGLLSNKMVHATQSAVNLQQMVTDMRKLDLDTAYSKDLAIIANMYGIDKDVLGLESSTYENYQKALGGFVDFTLMPKAEQDANVFQKIFGFNDLRASFKHMPFNEVFNAEKQSNDKMQLESLKLAQELGVDANVIKEKATTIITG